MLDGERAASELTLHPEKLTSINGLEMFQHSRRKKQNKDTLQSAIKSATGHHLYLVYIFLAVRLIKKKRKQGLAIEQKICIATGRQRDWTLTQDRG